MTSSNLFATSFTLQTNTSGVPLWASLKRYTKVNSSVHKAQSGYVLIFAHGAGFHKEQWEPTISHLFKLDTQNTIREAWAMDCQNHGEAAILNERVLVAHPRVLSVYDYADALVTLRRDLLGDANPDYSREDRFILIGHSAGAIACVLALAFFNPPSNIMFDSLVLVETTIRHPSSEVYHTAMYKTVATVNRHDIWASREAAKVWLGKRFPWKDWDPEVLDIYVNQGLRPLPTAFYPDKTDGVTLNATWADENSAYTKDGATQITSLWHLNILCGALPVHLIYGAKNDLISREIQDSIIDASEGRTFASITRIPGAGHWVIQETPTKTADALWKIMATPIPLHRL